MESKIAGGLRTGWGALFDHSAVSRASHFRRVAEPSQPFTRDEVEKLEAPIERDFPSWGDRFRQFSRDCPTADKALTVAALAALSGAIALVAGGLTYIISHLTKRKNDNIAWIVGGIAGVTAMVTHTSKVFGLHRIFQMKYHMRHFRSDYNDPLAFGVSEARNSILPVLMAVVRNARQPKSLTATTVEVTRHDIREALNYVKYNRVKQADWQRYLIAVKPGTEGTDSRLSMLKDEFARKYPNRSFDDEVARYTAKASDRGTGIEEGVTYYSRHQSVQDVLDHDLHGSGFGPAEANETHLRARWIAERQGHPEAQYTGIRLDELRAIQALHADAKPGSLYRLGQVIGETFSAFGDVVGDSEKAGGTVGSGIAGPITITAGVTAITALVAGVSSTNTSLPLPANVKAPGAPAVPALVPNPHAASTYNAGASGPSNVAAQPKSPSKSQQTAASGSNGLPSGYLTSTPQYAFTG